MSLRSTFDLRKATGTWAGHAALCWALAMLTGILVPPHGALWSSAISMCYFLAREAADKVAHLREGNYDRQQTAAEDGGEPVTSRVDRVGDLIGPVAVFAGALAAELSWLLGG